jgi:DNA-binding transcriptional MerR regulator
MATVNAVNVVAHCSKTQKRKFATKQEAEQFEERNRAQRGTAKQYAYACEECDSYHLSSLLPGANGHSTITTNYAAIENGKAPTGHRQRRWTTEDDVKQMRELRARGLTPAEIAARLDFSQATVNKHLTSTVKRQPVSLDIIALKKKELEEQLRKLHEEEQRMIEAKRLKVAKLLDGSIQIRKEAAFIVLSPDDCTDLYGKLEEILTETAVPS